MKPSEQRKKRHSELYDLELHELGTLAATLALISGIGTTFDHSHGAGTLESFE